MVSSGLGYLRDFVAAIIGLLILFGVEISDQQMAGLLLVVATGGAFGTYLWNKLHGAKTVNKKV